jgi:hypothetical protein
MIGWRRTEPGRPAANIGFSTATPTAASVCWALKPRARRRGPISALQRPIVVSIVRTQPAKRFPLAVGTGRDDVADFDGAIGDDHAIDQQFEQRPLLVEVSACQAVAHTAAERLGLSCQASRFALAFGIVREFGELC